jgi:uncharacterized protein
LSNREIIEDCRKYYLPGKPSETQNLTLPGRNIAMSNDRPIAVVTGASSGIGRVYADRLAARGHDLILVARRKDRLMSLATDLRDRHGAAVEPMTADLTDEVDIARLEARLGSDPRIAVLVNSAGTVKLARSLDWTNAEAAASITLNVVAVARLSRAAFRSFVARDAGTIINVASGSALHALTLNTLYSATKAFVLNLTRGLEQEVSGSNVRLQAVLPALTATEIFDHGDIPLSSFDPAMVISAEDMVDAALVGLDRGEAVTFPSLHDATLLERFDAARLALYEAAAGSGTAAPRYRKAA